MMPERFFSVANMRSQHCCEEVEKAARGVPGVEQARANLETQRLDLQIGDAFSEASLTQAIQSSGYELSPIGFK